MTSTYAIHEHHEFVDAAEEALASPNLQEALSRLGETLAAGTRREVAALPGSSLRRDKARAIKDHTLSRLDEYIAQLESVITARGGFVHFAETGDEANEIVAAIAKRRGATKIVISKSMVTEEIHLNRHLEQAGIEVTETDFGEFIIQLAGERPSHIVAPVVHKTVEE